MYMNVPAHVLSTSPGPLLVYSRQDRRRQRTGTCRRGSHSFRSQGRHLDATLKTPHDECTNQEFAPLEAYSPAVQLQTIMGMVSIEVITAVGRDSLPT